MSEAAPTADDGDKVIAIQGCIVLEVNPVLGRYLANAQQLFLSMSFNAGSSISLQGETLADCGQEKPSFLLQALPCFALGYKLLQIQVSTVLRLLGQASGYASWEQEPAQCPQQKTAVL